ncbi:hypothetical protein F443_16618 [Phytophthora nicotianae P1569]|uniref:Uncharacterized protein n=2 Tax=Phytophthora nicotianae TaxID=4792 RepID=V9EH67_PHYNI|nr:hypothetical protein F443_16618 [Phytophthora nicotianae P1569]
MTVNTFLVEFMMAHRVPQICGQLRDWRTEVNSAYANAKLLRPTRSELVLSFASCKNPRKVKIVVQHKKAVTSSLSKHPSPVDTMDAHGSDLPSIHQRPYFDGIVQLPVL